MNQVREEGAELQLMASRAKVPTEEGIAADIIMGQGWAMLDKTADNNIDPLRFCFVCVGNEIFFKEV